LWNTFSAVVTFPAAPEHALSTAVEMMDSNLLELAVQKQLKEVVWPPSPQPLDISRTIVLTCSSAHLESSEYSGTWLMNISWHDAICMCIAKVNSGSHGAEILPA
jgi:hypothetical protein